VSIDNGDAPVPSVAARVFGNRADVAGDYVDLLRRHGVERGLIGPRELDRLWSRHVLNSAVIGEQIPTGARVIDVGSGAGLPGVPLAIARPDLDIVLLEPMARRVDWLTEVADRLDLHLTIVRGRAEEREIQRQFFGADVVTARAVAPLARLAAWCLPLVRQDGLLLALKGASAGEELERDRAEVTKSGGVDPEVRQCGSGLVEPASTVVVIRRARPSSGKDRCGKGRPKSSTPRSSR
jgi:16S rRNA (guanine527-N7)-methyltransferase